MVYGYVCPCTGRPDPLSSRDRQGPTFGNLAWLSSPLTVELIQLVRGTAPILVT